MYIVSCSWGGHATLSTTLHCIQTQTFVAEADWSCQAILCCAIPTGSGHVLRQRSTWHSTLRSSTVTLVANSTTAAHTTQQMATHVVHHISQARYTLVYHGAAAWSDDEYIYIQPAAASNRTQQTVTVEWRDWGLASRVNTLLLLWWWLKRLIQPGTVEHYNVYTVLIYTCSSSESRFFNPPTSTHVHTVLLCGKQYLVSSVVAGEGL